MFSRTFSNYIEGSRTITMIYLNWFDCVENFKRKKWYKTFSGYILCSTTFFFTLFALQTTNWSKRFVQKGMIKTNWSKRNDRHHLFETISYKNRTKKVAMGSWLIHDKRMSVEQILKQINERFVLIKLVFELQIVCNSFFQYVSFLSIYRRLLTALY